MKQYGRALEVGHVVEEKKIGNTRILICDDYCRDKTPEEIEQALDRIALVAYLDFEKSGKLLSLA